MNNNNNWNHPANHPSTITREQLLAALATYTKASQGTGDVHTFVHGLTLFLDGQVMANLTNERLDATRDNLKKNNPYRDCKARHLHGAHGSSHRRQCAQAGRP